MTKTLAFLNRKGGCGKTTNAVNVAKELRRRGHRVILVETDRNYTPAAIKATETYIAPQSGMTIDHVTGKALTHEGIRTYLRKVKERDLPDYIVIDGAAEMSAAVLSAITSMSDIVLIPTNLDTLEIDATKLTLADIMQGRKLNPAVHVAILPSRIHWGTKQENAMNALASMNTPVLPYITNFKEYRIHEHRNPAGIYRTLVRQILAMIETDVTFIPEESVTTSKRHFLKCHYSACTFGNVKPGWFFSDRPDTLCCCDTHRQYYNREKKRIAHYVQNH